jgi:hypothetical protein
MLGPALPGGPPGKERGSLIPPRTYSPFQPAQAPAETLFTFEVLKIDGAPIGTIVAIGLAGGDAPPGSPLTGSAPAAGRSCRTGSLRDGGPRETAAAMERNTTVDSPSYPDVRAASDHCRRPGRDPFQRLLSCYFD